MEQTMVFFDIDGTLLDYDKNIPASTKEAVQLLKHQGHDVAIATGRAPFQTEDIRRELGIDSYVSSNGQYVVFRGEVVYKNVISPELLESFTRFAESYNHPLLYVGEEQLKVNTQDHADVNACYASHLLGIPEFDPSFYKGKDILQCILFCTAEEEGPYFNTFGHQLKMVRWDPVASDVLPTTTSKAAGIQKLIQHAGYTPERVAAFGDHLNDREMLAYVGQSVAMGNALDEIKQIAKYTTTDVDQDGIYNGLKHLGLI
ncbi:Cof subfamily protein (haloacid dehalogenase superfamily) [Paenibacillus shirakamiensis]|uniref:Cof subfamily protein (Haloacid dehalogenase superfamily) n=1 Tax=Paenibacillus shirakamiensis TaxID=1265935 RepID=A0ABS4JF30_9BACL|nr:Cof-type HAD-IIB family hydrolase [Paenibacillus shirakamiensis]MBP2000319.1 Cof subfamily protein (haloacid dehalogenase superfamily) [Paenibacillus shirakamiensis]